MRWFCGVLLVISGCTAEPACQCQLGEMTLVCGQAAEVEGQCITCTGPNVASSTPLLCAMTVEPGVTRDLGTPSPDLRKTDGPSPSNDPDPDPTGCPTGYTNCNGTCVDLNKDSSHCGSCDQSCGSLPNVYSGYATCKAGQCVIGSNGCRTYYADCNGDWKDGCEASLTASTSCGACGKSCDASAPMCVYKYSSYACDTGCGYSTPSLCNGTCVDTSSNVSHCGMCGNACVTPSHGSVACVSYACKVTCDPGYVVCPSGCCSGWPVTTADPLQANGPIGRASLVVDGNKVEHVAYVSKKLQELMYAKSDAGGVTLERIDGPFAPSATIEDVRIARTSDGTLHVVYQVLQAASPTNRDLYHAQRGGSGWVRDKLDSGAQVSGGIPVAGASGALFIFHTHTYSPTVVNRLVTRSAAGTYASEDLNVGGAFAVTPAGVPALAYAGTSSAIKYGTRGASGWTFEDVGQSGSVGALSFDPAGHPYVTFYSGSTQKEAHKVDTFWETLTRTGSSAIFFDGSGVPFGAGKDWSGNLFVEKFTTTWASTGSSIATNSSSDNWMGVQFDSSMVPHHLVSDDYSNARLLDILTPGKSVRIDSERKPGTNVQMAGDASGTLHLVYSDEATSELWYATLKAGVWKQEKLPVSGRIFKMALSSTGIPSVCMGNYSLSYLTRATGAWVSETVPSVSNASSCSLALDSAGKPHLAFGDSSRHISYARKTGTAWEKFDVEPTNTTSGDTLIAIDGSGSPQVLFYSSSLILGRWNGTRFVQQSLGAGLSPVGQFLYDAAGTGHLLVTGGTGGLTYGSVVGNTFTSEALITESGRTGSGTLILGATGPMVALLSANSYPSNTDVRLSIAKKPAGTWERENVAALSPSGTPGLALVSGKLVAAFYDTTYGRLLLAKQP